MRSIMTTFSLVLHDQVLCGQEVHNQVTYDLYKVFSFLSCSLQGIETPVTVTYRTIGFPHQDGTYATVNGRMEYFETDASVVAIDLKTHGQFRYMHVRAPFVTTPRLSFDAVLLDSVVSGPSSLRSGVFQVLVLVTVERADESIAMFEIGCSFNRSRKVFKTLPMLYSNMSVAIVGDIIAWDDGHLRIDVVKFEFIAYPPPFHKSERIETTRRRSPSPVRLASPRDLIPSRRSRSPSPVRGFNTPSRPSSPFKAPPAPFAQPSSPLRCASPLRERRARQGGTSAPYRTPSPVKALGRPGGTQVPAFLKSALARPEERASVEELLQPSVPNSEPVKNASQAMDVDDWLACALMTGDGAQTDPVWTVQDDGVDQQARSGVSVQPELTMSDDLRKLMDALISLEPPQHDGNFNLISGWDSSYALEGPNTTSVTEPQAIIEPDLSELAERHGIDPQKLRLDVDAIFSTDYEAANSNLECGPSVA